MKIHSDILTTRDLYDALPEGVHASINTKGSRKRDHAFDATLYLLYKDDLHRRYGNSGGYGSKDDVAATWDEWGIWIARLYALDPDALVGWYTDPYHFEAETEKYRQHVQAWNKPESLAWRTHTAPWLDGVAV